MFSGRLTSLIGKVRWLAGDWIVMDFTIFTGTDRIAGQDCQTGLQDRIAEWNHRVDTGPSARLVGSIGGIGQVARNGMGYGALIWESR